ncbi:endosomal/lysosomal proton channel TMEM175 isoform X2 [Erinaceus europaeus]|uniref:Endosomal/lysosomal proton channel TMEM175 n=1 Tax=Erinaceus europaeus TaxID=9365 RepID=A0ABM3X6B4_ERIEU|nr:endosomal/lysosomal proton channel TMEM175 isoform X2 [Erinaceus europaeus]
MSKKDSTISLCALQAGIQPPSCGSEPQVPTGLIMSGSPTLEPPLDTQGDTSLSSRDEDVAGETQHSQRMLSFSDGLLSIIATVMILPVTHTEISPEQEFDKGVQKLLATRIAVYLMTFLIVTVAWAAHARLFQIVGKIDDTLALLNLACMMTITFLPFTFSLMVTFPEAPLGIFLFCMCVVAIGGVQPLRPDISPQGPVPQAHPGPCASGPCPVPPGCRLLPVLLPGVLPADGHSHLPALCQQGHPLVLGKAHRPQAAAGPPRGQLPGPKRGPQQGAGRGLQRRGLRHRGHPTHPGHMRGQRTRPPAGAGAVRRQPSGGAGCGGAPLPGLFRLLRHSGAAVVHAPLPVPARAEGHARHGAAQRAVAGLRGRPSTGLPADVGLRTAAAGRAGARAGQLRHHLPGRPLPVLRVDSGPAAPRGDAAARGPGGRPRARLHVRQAGTLPLRQPAGLLCHPGPQPLQCHHLPPHAAGRARRLPAAASAGAPEPGCREGPAPHPGEPPGPAAAPRVTTPQTTGSPPLLFPESLLPPRSPPQDPSPP